MYHYQYTQANSRLDQGLEIALVAKRIPILGHFWSFHPIKQGSIFLLSGRVLCYLTNFISCEKSHIDHSMKYFLSIEMANHHWIISEPLVDYQWTFMKLPFLTSFFTAAQRLVLGYCSLCFLFLGRLLSKDKGLPKTKLAI